MYTNSGKRGSTHDNTLKISSVSAPSYVNVQVFAPMYANTYQSIACTELHATTHIQVPRTHVLVSFASEDPSTLLPGSICRREVDMTGGRPLVHITLGTQSTKTMKYLKTNIADIASVVSQLEVLEQQARGAKQRAE
jgi:hypothetical protein